VILWFYSWFSSWHITPFFVCLTQSKASSYQKFSTKIHLSEKGGKIMFEYNLKSKSIFLSGLIVGLFLLSISLIGSSWAASPNNPFNSLQQQIDNLQAQVTTLQGQVTTLQTQEANLQSQVSTLQSAVATLEAGNAALQIRVTALENNSVLQLNGYLSLDTDNNGYPVAQFEGVNVQIVNGQGSTAIADGLGNLIVGYNELRPTPGNNVRTGSHNIISGKWNNYSSFGGLVIGHENDISGKHSSVSGGAGNEAMGDYSSVSGGMYGIASGPYSSVSGGHSNTASGQTSSVSGGQSNTASGITSSSVSGGYSNTASGVASSVSGGTSNIASGSDASVSGGQSNTASGTASSVSGGYNRAAPSSYNWRGGNYISND
jgi:trimeric autotransporter adhesin